MRIQLIAIGTRMPDWVQAGWEEYAKRLPPECSLNLVEVPLGKRGKGADIPRLVRQEGERMAGAIPRGAHVVTLEVEGRPWSTPALADRLQQWLGGGSDVALLVGGPEGLAEECRALARERWSLSPLTLPHPLVRIVVAEQVYRAWSILQGHPYHR
jgi:23S rRNA (pseudouridine1915-N3)-methyltransferase